MWPASEPEYEPPEEWLFRCDVERDGEFGHVRAVGEFDLHAVPDLSAEIAELRETGCRHVTIDLSELTFLDSSGVRFLLDRCAEARNDGYAISLIPGPPPVQRVFELTGTAEHLPFIAP